MARRCQVWPDVPFHCSGNGWMWPGVALRLWSLAPSLAPRKLVSSANVQTAGTPGTSVKRARKSADRLPGQHPDEKVSPLSLLAPGKRA